MWCAGLYERALMRFNCRDDLAPGRPPARVGRNRDLLNPEDAPMYIAMNSFQGHEGRRERVRKRMAFARDSISTACPGFSSSICCADPSATITCSIPRTRYGRARTRSLAWTQSEHFRAAHRGAGENKPLYLGHPEFEGFERLQTIRNPNAGERAA